jgi:hypothetical protein
MSQDSEFKLLLQTESITNGMNRVLAGFCNYLRV